MKTNDVALSERINRAARYLTRILNPDGGIPAVKPGDPSGCWTTAEGVQAVLASPWLDDESRDAVRRMSAFLLYSQLSKVSRGAWPLVAGGRQGSTMATAQAILALHQARLLLDAGSAQTSAQASTSASAWLRDNQAPDGGWGVEPNGGPSGRASRVVAAFLALRALSFRGDSVRTSHSIRRGVDWLWTAYDGAGFRPAPDHQTDVCATVRALWAIQACGALDERPRLLERAVHFIDARRPAQGLWPVDTEVYVPDSAPGQIVFNNNTTAELLDFFIQFDEAESAQTELVHWFEEHQRDDGSWCLGANQKLEPDIIAWPTNEALLALSNFLRCARFRPARVAVSGSDQSRQGASPGPRPRSFLLWMFASLAVIEAIFLFGAPSYLVRSWINLPGDYRRTFFGTAMIAVILNILSTIIVYVVRRLFSLRHRPTHEA